MREGSSGRKAEEGASGRLRQRARLDEHVVFCSAISPIE